MIPPEIMRLLRHSSTRAAAAMAQNRFPWIAIAPFAHHLALLALSEPAQGPGYKHASFLISLSGGAFDFGLGL